MKYYIILILTVLSVSVYAQQDNVQTSPAAGIPPMVNLKTDTFSLPNGLKVVVVENHRLPTITCNLELDIKPELEGNMAGYHDLMQGLFFCGTASRDRQTLVGEIDGMDAKFEPGDQGIYAYGMKRNEKKILDILADMTMNTVFSQPVLDKIRAAAMREAADIKQNPDGQTGNVSALVNFGGRHPYGQIADETTLKNITLAACTNYYKTYFRPNVAYLAIVGDVTADELRPEITKLFGKWPYKAVPEATYDVAGLTGERPTQVYFIPVNGAQESIINITYPIDIKPGAPDAIISGVANSAFGGANGRALQYLRDSRGWISGAYSSLTPDALGGTFSFATRCRNGITDSVIWHVLDEMKQLQANGIPDSDLQCAKKELAGQFAIGMENPRVVAQYAINLYRYQFEPDYYQKYLKRLYAVNRGDVVERARKYFMPDNVNIIVAGNRDEVAEKLAVFSSSGKVKYMDGGGSKNGSLAPGTIPAGIDAEKVIAKYVAAIGGSSAIKTINDLKIVSTCDDNGKVLTITELKKAPNKWEKTVTYSERGSDIQVQKITFNGDYGYLYEKSKPIKMTPDDLSDMIVKMDMYRWLTPTKLAEKRELMGRETDDGTDLYKMIVTDKNGEKYVEYYDANSGLLVKRIQGTVGHTQVSVYEDYREVPGTGGYKIPYRTIEKKGGRVITSIVKSVEINTGVSDGEFD